jgi:hypothetical protein
VELKVPSNAIPSRICQSREAAVTAFSFSKQNQLAERAGSFRKHYTRRQGDSEGAVINFAIVPAKIVNHERHEGSRKFGGRDFSSWTFVSFVVHGSIRSQNLNRKGREQFRKGS